MRIVFLGAEVGNPTSGQSRFLVNLARGVRESGHEVSVAAAALGAEADRALKGRGIATAQLGEPTGRFTAQARLMTSGSRLGRRVGALAVASFPADWYVVLSDAAVDAIEMLPSDRSVYLSNGDLSLMFLSPSFYRSHSTAKQWLARGMAVHIRQNAARTRRYRRLLANCEFTRNFMSYLYGVPFSGVVYPPVDREVFVPAEIPGEPYVLAVARNLNEQGLDLLEELASSVRLRVVGGARVAGAEGLGVVDDRVLASLYCGARFTVTPVVSELFGYSVAESLACGTPVLAFDCAGPAEQLESGRTGWLARSASEFVALGRRLYSDGYPPSVRPAARSASERFGLAASAQALVRELEQGELPAG